jgi:hypothetical protein
MTVFVVTSTDREHGGTVIEGVFGTHDKAWDKMAELHQEEPYWRINFCYEYNLETGEKLVPVEEVVQETE